MDGPNHSWSIAETLVGILLSILSLLGVVAGWITNKFSGMHKRINDVERKAMESDAKAAESIAELRAYHGANTTRLSRIEDGILRMEERLDDLLFDRQPRRPRKRTDSEGTV